MIKNNELAQFIKDVQFKFENWGEIRGCLFKQLTDGITQDLYLVFTSEDNSLICKIAYNDDYLQSDYDFDWHLPTDTDGDVVDTEETHCEEDDANELAERVLDRAYTITHDIPAFAE